MSTLPISKATRWRQILVFLIVLILGFEFGRSIFRAGDFKGYITAGQAVLGGIDIYADFFNTWPPFFALFSVPLALIEQISPVLVRALWLAGSLFVFWQSMVLLTDWVYQKRLAWRALPNEQILKPWDLPVFIPLLIAFRYLLDNLANVQINIYMMWLVLLVFQAQGRDKLHLAGFLLAFSISLKVYPVFVFFFFLYRRQWTLVAWTILFLTLINGITILTFGLDQGLAYYQHWWQEIASSPPSVILKNQSVFGLFYRIFTGLDPGLGVYVNWFDWSLDKAKKIGYALILLAAIFPAIRLWQAPKNPLGRKGLVEIALLCTLIPLLSPLSWKAYFIFLWVPYFVLYAELFTVEALGRSSMWRILYLASVLLTVFSTEGIVGAYFSDVLETLSCITLGALMLVIALLGIYPALEDNSERA
ncbi:MAG: glycosyltransferase family 87 protein [Bacteroidota bacterium]